MLYLLRHGLDDENYIGGWSNVSLTEEGKASVYKSALWLKENTSVNQIISSDIKRAKETSLIVSSVLQVPIKYEQELREQSKGILNGMLKSQAQKLYPELFENITINTKYPQGSSIRELYYQMSTYLKKLKAIDEALLVTHRGNINMIYYLLYGIPLDMDKERFQVEHASVHELDLKLKKIRRVK